MTSRKVLLGVLLAVGVGVLAFPATAGPPGAPRWSIVVTTAPHLPQDVWYSGMGNNTDGWNGGGSICINQLAQGQPNGEQLTALIDVVEGGIYGVDGAPVPPGTYTFPGVELPAFDYTVTPGVTFYVITEGYIVQSKLPAFPVGTVLRSLWMWDYQPGRNDVHVVMAIDFGFGFVPFLNEGVMMASTRLHP
jgi:hypothetical protein